MYNAPPKMTKKKMIELILLIVGILWFILLGINYVRYTKNKPLLVAIHHKSAENEYPDGYVEEWISLGYVYRVYNRVAISREEFVPFWIITERPKAENDLPKVETGYTIPDNPRKYDKYMGLLYFYSTENTDLLGTYKCINSTQDCAIATNGWDRFDIIGTDPLTKRDPYKFANLYNKYAFIDDSSKQDLKYGDNGYVRTIYLYQFNKKDPKILYRFADIKETSYDELKELANLKKYVYIVKDYESQKWGIVKITESGAVNELLPFDYDSITYDADTDYYIVCKNNVWFAYDLDEGKQVSVESVDVIYDIWKNINGSYYFKTGRERTVGNETFMEYKVYRFDGQEFLKGDKISEVIPRRTYVMYVTDSDKVLHFMTYSKQEKAKLQLYFTKLDHDSVTHPAFEIYTESDYSIAFKVYQGRELKYDYDVETVFTTKWELNEDD